MIDPTNITRYNQTMEELEEVLLFWICAAGKNGVTTGGTRKPQGLPCGKSPRCESSRFHTIQPEVVPPVGGAISEPSAALEDYSRVRSTNLVEVFRA